MMPVKLTVTSNAAQRNEKSPANKRFLLLSLRCGCRNDDKKMFVIDNNCQGDKLVTGSKKSPHT